MRKAILCQDLYHSQFQLSTKDYLDNNNFIRINHVKVQDQRYKIWEGHKKLYFIDYLQKPLWKGKSFFYEENGSWDGGKNFKNETGQQLYGSYFFVSEEFVRYNFKVHNIIDIVSDFGGFAKVVVFGMWFISININK